MEQSQNMDAVHNQRPDNSVDEDPFGVSSQWALNKKRHEEMVRNLRDRERDVQKRVVVDQNSSRLVPN